MEDNKTQALSKKDKYLLKGKDLIFIGVYTAIYFVINMLFMLISGLHPVIWILLPAFIALFSGIPFMLICAKVQKPGAVFIMGGSCWPYLFCNRDVYLDNTLHLYNCLRFVGTCTLANKIRQVLGQHRRIYVVFIGYDRLAFTRMGYERQFYGTTCKSKHAV